MEIVASEAERVKVLRGYLGGGDDHGLTSTPRRGRKRQIVLELVVCCGGPVTIA